MNTNNLKEDHEECTAKYTNKNEEVKTEKDEMKLKDDEMLHSNTSLHAGNSRQISSISLKMISDCVNLVVDQSHIQLSSVIHISKKDNQLNIEHKMMESTSSNARESSSESNEENVINRNSFYANTSACSSTSRNHENFNVIVNQPSCSNHLTSVTSCVNSNPGTSAASSDYNRPNLTSATVNSAESATRNRPPPYTKNPGHNKRLSARQLLNQLYSGSGSTYQMDGTPFEQPPVGPRMFHHGVLGIPPLHGAPPTYSAVMRIGGNNPINTSSNATNSRLFNSLFRRPEVCLQPSAPFIAPPRPPTYAEVQGVTIGHRTPIEVADFDQDIPWGPLPLSVRCPNCGNIVMTAITLHRSNLTHFSALTLCLCGCWPCCLIPYCMKACKTTYHECPICFTVIGMFTPW